jgi:hypothetical protein
MHQPVDDEEPESEFWAMIRRVADRTKGWPDWKKAGINLNPHNFQTARECQGCRICRPPRDGFFEDV